MFMHVIIVLCMHLCTKKLPNTLIKYAIKIINHAFSLKIFFKAQIYAFKI